uniref:FKBP3 basic tilted helix bundle domain-containing protein n=1 Tax=Rhinolophus ferrumequinum TaxID=59479 RepID=A0A671FRR1_RHIFE
MGLYISEQSWENNPPWELSREDIIRFLQNRGSVSVLAEHKLLGNIYKMWPREVTKMLVLAYNHIFANKHFRAFRNY